MPVLLEINISLSNKYRKSSQYIYNDCIIDVAEELFISHLVRLPRIIYTGDEEEQMANILQLNGLVTMLCKTDRLKITLSIEGILDNFMASLLSIVEIDRVNGLLEENNNIFDVDDKTPENINSLTLLRNHTQWKSYKNLRNNELLREVLCICDCISKLEPINVLILEYLVKLITQNSVNCNEAIIIVQMMIPNAFDNADPCSSLHFELLEELFTEFRWDLATETTENQLSNAGSIREWYEDRTEGLYESAISIRMSDTKHQEIDQRFESITIGDIKNNILHMCLVIETVGLYAKQLRDQYQRYLLRSLHRLLEKSTSTHNMIRTSALIALNNLKIAFQLNSISELILENSDYISHSINMALKHPNQIDTALRILSIVLHYCSVESIPHLESIISTALLHTKKLNQTDNVLSFMRVFELILSTIRQNIDGGSKSSELVNNEKINCQIDANPFETWISILNENINLDEDEDGAGETDKNDEEMDIDDEENEKSIPILVQLSIDIIKRCIPYLGSKNKDTKLIALKCLVNGLDIIHPYENELLPIVHLMWDPFCHQSIRDKNAVVLRYCIQLLAKLAQYSKEFIYKRSIE